MKGQSPHHRGSDWEKEKWNKKRKWRARDHENRYENIVLEQREGVFNKVK